ncbi:MAG: energy transducer TonB [Phycisphaerae bacterium]|nr:energy transducer TonB [Phycisphaerae bacterium]
MIDRTQTIQIFQNARHRASVVLGAVGLTLLFFLVLPLMQTITAPLTNDLFVTEVDLGSVEPPPPSPPEEEVEPEPEAEEQPMELDSQEAPPLDLSQLELALNPGGFGDGWMGGMDFAVKLNAMASTSSTDNLDAVFSMADLDQKPRVISQRGPTYTKQLRKNAPAKVNVIFIVNELGRVVDPKVKNATNAMFEMPALAAVKQWRFEPGKRAGKPVRFRMLAPITFPKE